MAEWVVVVLLVVGFLVAGLGVIAAIGAVMLVADGLARLAGRIPGGFGCSVHAWELKDPGTPTAFVAVVLLLGFLVLLWSGFLGRVLILSGIRS